MMTHRAVIDTCVLLPITLCDTLLRLAYRDVFAPQWTDHILAELERNLGPVAHLDQDAVARRVGTMRRAFPLAMVTGYEPLIDQMRNDPRDRHVAAAAVHSESKQIVTANLKDFPDHALAPYGIAAVHPDDFLLSLLESRPGEVIAAIRHQAQSYRKPPMSVPDLLGKLKQFVPAFVDDLSALTS
ncbi:PIN domain-containing protein [Myceligenerans crystallogenes]|uniref:PIN domain-containing protein n=1 Tax=Myceligenerans crystallogenes TaxID=316335 RepID=A0ABP4ZP39_9MICO